jgi:N-acetylneuraminate synthase
VLKEESMKINGVQVSKNSEVYLIAEIGINHNGSLNTALKLIEEAKKSGFNAVKFQKRNIDVVYSLTELAQPRESVFGTTNGDLKRGLEFGESEYSEINEFCKDQKIDWFASPWDVESVDFLENLDVVAHKVASACNSDKDLLKRINETGKPVFLSTGMSTLEMIEKSLDYLDHSKLVLLHAVSTYPAENSNLNLNWINILKEKFPHIPIGYSGHEVGIVPSVVAVAKYGACCVERHITLDRSMWGSDQAASLEPAGMKKLVSYIREIPQLHGSDLKIILSEEEAVSKKLRRVNSV